MEQPENPISEDLKPSIMWRLCIALGACTTSPIESLYFEANEPTLSLRRYKPALKYYAKLISCPQNPAYSCIMEIRYKKTFRK